MGWIGRKTALESEMERYGRLMTERPESAIP